MSNLEILSSQELPSSLAYWRKSHDESVAELDPDQASYLGAIEYVGVMSSNYKEQSGFLPVSSGLELFTKVPPRYMGVSAQIGVTIAGSQMAIPYTWKHSHQALSDLVVAMIGVLVAFVTDELQQKGVTLHQCLPEEMASLPDGSDAIGIEVIQQYLTNLFCEIHFRYYGDYPDRSWVISEINKRIAITSEKLEQYLSEHGKEALAILRLLSFCEGDCIKEWVDGLRELGKQAVLEEKGLFAGKNQAFWLAAFQAAFQLQCCLQVMRKQKYPDL